MTSSATPWAIEMTLPFPPTVNHYWILVNNHPVIGPRGRRYRCDVEALAVAAGISPLHGYLEVWIEAIPPDGRHRDLDNLLKATLDAMQHAGFYRDDYRISDLRITRRIRYQDASFHPDGALLVRIREIPQRMPLFDGIDSRGS